MESKLFGSKTLDGGQTKYVRVPLADGTIAKAPTNISNQALLLMGDIFPTSYFGVKSAVALSSSTQDIRHSTMAIIGCGPVGLCAIIAGAHLQPKHLFTIDAVDSRLEVARRLGAEPLNFKKDKAGMDGSPNQGSN